MSQTQCPKCSKDLGDDYGMVTCPTCSTLIFIDMEGNPQIAQAEENEVQNIQANQEQNKSEVSDSQDLVDQPVEAFGSLESAVSYEASEHVEIQDQVQPVEALKPVNQDVNDPLDLTSYANAEFSQGKDGLYVYDLMIADIDTKELKDALLEALDDQRFRWDSKKIITQIVNGKLTLKKLSAVKASILIQRLKKLTLQIKWEQHAITDAHLDLQ